MQGGQQQVRRGYTAQRSPGDLAPDQLERDRELLELIEQVRRLGAVDLGLAATPEEAAAAPLSLPFVGFCAPPEVGSSSGDPSLLVRLLSSGTAHRAVPLGAALAVAAACRVPGTVAHGAAVAEGSTIRLGHPSGVLPVEVETDGGDAVGITSVGVTLTARRIMEGTVWV